MWIHEKFIGLSQEEAHDTISGENEGEYKKMREKCLRQLEKI